MSDLSDGAVQVLFASVVSVGPLLVAACLTRVSFHKEHKPWPAIVVGIYNILLLLLYVFGDLTQVTSEGFGFLPLMALTLPLSFCTGSVGRWVNSFLGAPFTVTLVFPFVFLNVLCGATNSCVLILLLRRWQGRRDRENATG
jgi:hypothetical protein